MAVPSYPVAFALTLLIETVVYVVGAGAAGWPAVGSSSRWGWVGFSVVVNLATHPLLWWLSGPDPGWWRLGGCEAAVVIVEAIAVRLCARARPVRAVSMPASWSSCLALSFAANAASLGGGWLVLTLISAS